MKLCYFTLIKCNEDNITEIKVPDLGLSFTEENFAGIHELGLKKFVESCIEKRVRELQEQHIEIPEPTKIENFADELSMHDFYMPVVVDIQLRKSFFTRLLPFVGSVSCVVSAMSGSVISTIALQLAMNDVSNKDASLALSMSQAIISNMLGIIIYFYSSSNLGLARLGAKIDALISRKPSAPREESKTVETRSCRTNSCFFVMKALLGAATIINTVSNATSTNQQLDALGEQAYEAGLVTSEAFFQFCSSVLIMTAGVSGLSFVSGFIAQLYADFEKYVLRKSTSSSSSFHSDRKKIAAAFAGEEMEAKDVKDEENTSSEAVAISVRV